MRADRLIELLLLLQTRTQITAKEAQALFLSLGPALKTSPALSSALKKLLVAIPETFRSEAELAAQAIKVDPTGWSRVGVAKPVFLDDLTAAVVAGNQTQIRYQSKDQQPKKRIVHPLGLVTKRNIWYLIANTNKGMRTFRLDRISFVKTLDQAVDRPKDFDLDEAWQKITTKMDQTWSTFTVRGKVRKHKITPLRWLFGKHLEVVGHEDKNWLNVTIGAYNVESFAAQIAGFGSALILENPPREVVEELQRISTELAEMYG